MAVKKTELVKAKMETTLGTAGAADEARAAAAVEVDEGAALLAVPMKRVLTTQGEQGYATTRVDVALSGRQAAALRDVFDALVARGTWKKPNPSAGDAVRWILDRLAEEFEKENEKEKGAGG